VENIILVPVQSLQHGRDLLESLGRLAEAGEIEVRAAAIVERHPDGRWHFPEQTAQPSYQGTITSGAVGALIGLLAAPAAGPVKDSLRQAATNVRSALPAVADGDFGDAREELGQANEDVGRAWDRLAETCGSSCWQYR
jgi:hypothetical protein